MTIAPGSTRCLRENLQLPRAKCREGSSVGRWPAVRWKDMGQGQERGDRPRSQLLFLLPASPSQLRSPSTLTVVNHLKSQNNHPAVFTHLTQALLAYRKQVLINHSHGPGWHRATCGLLSCIHVFNRHVPQALPVPGAVWELNPEMTPRDRIPAVAQLII